MDKFIKIYKKAYSKEECLSIIDFFEKNIKYSIDHRKKGSKTSFRGYKNIPGSLSDIEGTPHEFIAYHLKDCHSKYANDHQFLTKLDNWIIGNEFNLQKYEIGNCYYREHCEHGKNWYDCPRVLAWMVYLNDCDGGTCWPQQGFTSTPEEGDLYIWPASWNYSHYGVPSTTEKYILTGWSRFHKPDSILPETEPRKYNNMEWSREV